MSIQYDRAETGRETYQFAGGLITILADGAYTGGRYALLLANTPPGNVTPPHFHDADTETLTMLHGVMTAETGGRSESLYPGEFAILPPGQVHRLRNNGNNEARYLLLCAPAGFEDFVRQAGTRVDEIDAVPKEMDQDDVRRMVDNAPNYGIRLTDEVELSRAASNDITLPLRETFVARGTTIEVLARFGDDENAVVLMRATEIPKIRGLFAPPPWPISEAYFFAGTSGGSLHGPVRSISGPALLAFTSNSILELLKRDYGAAPINAKEKPLRQLLLVLETLHAAAGDIPEADTFVGTRATGAP